jgi:hypothetical protein
VLFTKLIRGSSIQEESLTCHGIKFDKRHRVGCTEGIPEKKFNHGEYLRRVRVVDPGVNIDSVFAYSIYPEIICASKMRWN